MSAFSDLEKKIAALQAKEKEGSPALMVGFQLLDMAREDARAAELLLQDLTVPEMDLTHAAEKIKEYADSHHASNRCFCVTPQVAEGILRKFYGLPERAPAGRREPDAGVIRVEDYL